jgi:type II secretory pathway component PulJ
MTAYEIVMSEAARILVMAPHAKPSAVEALVAAAKRIRVHGHPTHIEALDAERTGYRLRAEALERENQQLKLQLEAFQEAGRQCQQTTWPHICQGHSVEELGTP